MIPPFLLRCHRQVVHGSCGHRTGSPNAPPPRSAPRWTGRPPAAENIAEKLGNSSNVWMSMVFVVDLCVFMDVQGCLLIFTDFNGCSWFLIVQRFSWNQLSVKRVFFSHVPESWGYPKTEYRPQNPLDSNFTFPRQIVIWGKSQFFRQHQTARLGLCILVYFVQEQTRIQTTMMEVLTSKKCGWLMRQTLVDRTQ